MEVLSAVIQGLLLGGLFALAATGLSIMFGVMRIVNLAHGDLAILAAFVAFVFVVQTALPLGFTVRAEYERISSQYGDPDAFTVSAVWRF